MNLPIQQSGVLSITFGILVIWAIHSSQIRITNFSQQAFILLHCGLQQTGAAGVLQHRI